MYTCAMYKFFFFHIAQSSYLLFEAKVVSFFSVSQEEILAIWHSSLHTVDFSSSFLFFALADVIYKTLQRLAQNTTFFHHHESWSSAVWWCCRIALEHNSLVLFFSLFATATWYFLVSLWIKDKIRHPS